MNLRSAGCPAIQAFKFSKLSYDPESDAQEYNEYQEERAAKLDMAAGISNGQMVDVPEDEDANGVTEDIEITENSQKDKSGFMTCPICGRSFKPASNAQKYDSAVCRRRAQEMHRS